MEAAATSLHIDLILLVLCGLPGAGKTTLAQALRSQGAAHDVRVSYVGFDDIECTTAISTMMAASSRGGGGEQVSTPRMDEGEEAEGWSVTRWRASRQRAFQLAETMLQDGNKAATAAQGSEGSEEGGSEGGGSAIASERVPTRGKHVVILDDNMYYRSMRREAFKLAARHGVGFVIIYAQVALEVALRRNAGRPPERRVSEAVLLRMHERMQPPDPTKAPWEATHLVVTDTSTGDVWDVVEAAWSQPPAMIHGPPDEEEQALEAERVEASRLVTSNNVTHQMDLELRKMISMIMRKTTHQPAGVVEGGTGRRPPGLPGPRELALVLNDARQWVLEEVRSRRMQVLPQDEEEEMRAQVTRAFAARVEGQMPAATALLQTLLGEVLDASRHTAAHSSTAKTTEGTRR